MSDLRARGRRAASKPTGGSRKQTAATIARHGKLKKSSAFAALAKILAAVLGVVAASGASVAAIAAWDVNNALKPGVELVGPDGSDPPTVGAIDGAVNLLLVGSDSGEGNPLYGERDENLNDVTMLLHISADHRRATVVSFPRDLFVSIPECPDPDGGTVEAMSSQKINTSLSHGGLACSVLTVQKLTGMTIPYAAEIQFDGVVEMSNAIGGVPVCVADRISDDYTNLYLDPGRYTLKGAEALAFLRTRHGVGDGSDLGRISNQQVYLSSLVRTMKSSDTLGDPGKVYGLAKAAAKNMTLSQSLSSIPTMASIALALKDIDLDDVVFVQYPNALGTSGGRSGVLPLEDAADRLFAAIKADKPITLSGTTGLGSQVKTDASGGADADAAAPSDGATPDSGSAGPADGTEGTGSPGSGQGTDAGSGPVVLPDSVHGQTAKQQTCSKVQPNNQ